MKFGIIGSGSWGTALAKVLTDNNNSTNWWIRNEINISHLKARHHNPQYLSSAYFDTNLLQLTSDAAKVITDSDCIIVVVPSAYVTDVLGGLPKDIFHLKKVISAIKGILPEQ